ncbi:phage late control D family protein [Paenibacillus ehimensis]|uniref:Phage tail protein n=1 Tax=Paenibacillus ehimensis TaxID=79264 RepID=A0ABT8VI71_9BACL|nr:hypothetical protein [Paenibacillus ehimensis]MDO3680641.1 hypothetical protein [Paenibacillus ehimensis]
MFRDPLINRSGPFRPTGKPIVNISINGRRVSDWISFSVDLNGLGAVDTFDVTMPWEVSEQPRDELLFSGPDRSADLVTGAAIISLEAGFEGEGPLSLLIEGPMDHPTWDFSKQQGEIVSIRGRSYASRPFDFKETAKWQNLTSTAAFRQIAEQHGLTPVVPVETSKLIGEYVKDDHVNMKREVSHWDFVLYLAQAEEFTTRVKGKEWFFGPNSELPGFDLEPIPFSWGFNIDEPFRIERAPNAARNLTVEVISWAPGKKKGGRRIIEKATMRGSSSGHKYTLRYYYPNRTRDQCQQQARAILAELSKNQVYGSFSTDWFPELSNDRKISISGVGQGLNGNYFVPKVSITGSKEEGIRSEVTFTNLPLEEGGTFG